MPRKESNTNPRPKPCEICGEDAHFMLRYITGETGGCTNRRCHSCHVKWCGPGGSTSAGHARRWPDGGRSVPRKRET